MNWVSLGTIYLGEFSPFKIPAFGEVKSWMVWNLDRAGGMFYIHGWLPRETKLDAIQRSK